MKPAYYLLAASLLLSTSAASAQDDGKGKDKDKYKKEYKDKEYKDKDRKDYDKDRKDYDKDRRKDYEKDRKDYDKDRNERYKEGKEYKDRNDDRDDDDRGKRGDDDRDKRGRDGRYDNRYPRPMGGLGGVLGRVILPRAGTVGPRELAGVPRGQYPPPGECRVWYPNRPAGQQPPPTSCDRLAGARLEPGAFILHGDQAYDAEYNWREEDRRRPGTVGRDILDVLFPRR